MNDYYPIDDAETDEFYPEDAMVCDLCQERLRHCICADEAQRCLYCGEDFGPDMEAQWFPYCSAECVASARAESEEDSYE